MGSVQRLPIAYTILGSCRLAGVDPREYLADVLPQLTGLGCAPAVTAVTVATVAAAQD